MNCELILVSLLINQQSHLAYFPDLPAIYLYDNALTGTIPTEFGRQFTRLNGGCTWSVLSSSILLYLYFQHLTFPPLLSEFHLNENDLTGPIPTQLGEITRLSCEYT